MAAIKEAPKLRITLDQYLKATVAFPLDGSVPPEPQHGEQANWSAPVDVEEVWRDFLQESVLDLDH